MTPQQHFVNVNRFELSSYLKAFRQHSGLQPTHVLAQLRQVIESAKLPIDPHSRLRQFVSHSDPIAQLEGGGEGLITFHLSDFVLLGAAYNISYLMLLPLIADTSTDVCLLLAHSDFHQYAFDNFQKETGAEYLLPSRRLAGAGDTAIVRVVLPPNSCSERHSHPGNELLYVSSGEVEVRLSRTGAWNRITGPGFIHFFAEQDHTVINRSALPAEMLVIRFYQLPGTNVRYRVLEELENLRTKRYEAKGTRAVLSRVIDELRSTKEQVPEQANQGSVVDPFGLGRLLRLVIKESFRGPKKGLGVRDLVDRARELGLKKFATLSQIQALHAGTNKKIHRSDFSDIGKLYDVSPVLFHDFLFPTIQDSVTVRLSDDVRPIPVDSDDDKAREGYRAPCRRLGDTNVAVADIKLAPKSATPFNRHPGYEVLIPRSGNLRLVAAGSPYEIDHEKVVIAHYSSGHDHRIENIGDDDAEALVIRFYQ